MVLSVELVAKGILAGLKEGNVRSVSEGLRKVEKLEVAPMSLNMSDFRNEAHSSIWDHSAFVRTYVMYLDQCLELMFFNRKTFFTVSVAIANGGSVGGGGRFDGDRDNFRSPPPSSSRPYENDYESSGYGNYGTMRRTRSFGDVSEAAQEKRVSVTPLRDMKPERIFGKMAHLQRLLDRFLSCRPTGLAKNNRMILIALYPLVKESFQLYADICEVLAILLDKFFDMEYPDCVKTFDAYASAAKQIDELIAF